MAGMGGGGAGGTPLLARRSWQLVRGQRRVNTAAGAAEAQVGGTAEPCIIGAAAAAEVQMGWTKHFGALLERRRGGRGVMAKALLRLCWRRLRRAVVRLEELEVGGWVGGWVWDHRFLGAQGRGRCCWAGGEAWMRRMAAMVLEGVSADWGIGRRRKAAMAQGGT